VIRGVVGAAVVAVASGAAHADGGIVRGTVEVNRPSGVPAGAVLVYVVGFTEPPPAAEVSVAQQDRKFVPDLVAVTAGQTVAFPNGDPLLHNVYSPTADRTFDLGSYPRGEVRTRGFPKPGVIEVFCNIHPEMSATIVVLPNRRFALVDAHGGYEIRDVPAGTWTVFAYSRHAAHPTSATITVANGAVVETKLVLDEVQRDFAHRNKYGEKYTDDQPGYSE
jgi:plastocyanin